MTTSDFPANDAGTVPLRSTVPWFVYDSAGTLRAGAFGAISSTGLGLGLDVTCEIVWVRLVEM